MRRLQVGPSDSDVIVCSHGHYGQTTGPEGLIRRVVIRGRDPQEVPTTSRRALVGAGFEVIEDQ
jgi:metal-dependent hydrolase (beta-lactamase superfamily II)